ncbi:AbrB family transcriptional regulator [Aneurinibacillus aneurinilyticus]|nr:AbrB family transcriptional regulator [Aneurinibacillus aneurinilyticus]MCI1694487.1 AbrB family transcriptional regulator [Aneurinibacillus aneurinilyticus]MED0670854.1 AbrB family transcriptional regulator [Aneurinibacillus aneurinilyticus]
MAVSVASGGPVNAGLYVRYIFYERNSVANCSAVAIYADIHNFNCAGKLVYGSVPGGLSQMLVLSEETERVDVTIVAFMQTIRLLAVIFFVPFLTIHSLMTQPGDVGVGMPVSTVEWASFGWGQYAVYTLIALIGAWGGQRIGIADGASHT